MTTVHVRSVPGARFTHEAAARDHRLLVDEPADHGGDDRGPTPGDLLCAALGSCMAITVRMYAERKGWKVDAVTVRVTREGERFATEVGFDGELDAERRARLLQIAQRCPTHKTLTHVNGIETRAI
jgi:putative redox protein